MRDINWRVIEELSKTRVGMVWLKWLILETIHGVLADQILAVNGEITCTRAPSQSGCRACPRSRGGRGTVSWSWLLMVGGWQLQLAHRWLEQHFCCCYCQCLQLKVVIRRTWHRQAFPCYLPWQPQRRRVASPLEGFQLFFLMSIF